MAIQYLSKRNNFIIGFACILIIFLSCDTKRVLNVEEVFALKPSHALSNLTISKFIEDYKTKELNDKIDDTYIIYIINDDTQSKISIAKVYFPEFRKVVYRFKNLRELKGYLKYENDLVLLYGDVDNFFKENTKPIDIMYNEYKGTESVNYEPHFIDYYIMNSK